MLAADRGVRKRYAIDHATQTLTSIGTEFFSRGSAHGDLICPTDGHRYLLYVNNDNNPAFLSRVNIETGVEMACFTYPVDAYWTAQAEFISAVSKGPLQDWALCSSGIEAGPTAVHDDFTAPDPVATWGKMQNEIYMVNVLTGELGRLAHTRTRQVMTNYNYFPRVCVSWDGTRAAWASNMGYRSSPDGYADIWALDVPGGWTRSLRTPYRLRRR